MTIKISINTPLGEFSGNELNISDSEFDVFKEKIKFFWENGGFEMELENGGFLVLPPNVTQRSIIKIDIINR